MSAMKSVLIPDIPVFTVIADALVPSTLYLGTDIGVFVSLDAGATWSGNDNPCSRCSCVHARPRRVEDRAAGIGRSVPVHPFRRPVDVSRLRWNGIIQGHHR